MKLKFLSVFLTLFLVSCTSTKHKNVNSFDASDQEQDDFVIYEPDPLETFNRYVYGFNRIVDDLLLKKAAIAYKYITPTTVQYCVSSFLQNITEPLSATNHILQGNGKSTLKTLVRFALNTTLGFFGFIDFAKFIGIEPEKTDFNTTLSKWGVEAGPYIMLPIIGPTTFRGMFGYVFDYFADPFKYCVEHSDSKHNRHNQFKHYLLAAKAVDIIKIRADYMPLIDDIFNNSKDSYTSIRNIIFQKQYNIDNQK